jgi:hypothetical protein
MNASSRSVWATAAGAKFSAVLAPEMAFAGFLQIVSKNLFAEILIRVKL